MTEDILFPADAKETLRAIQAARPGYDAALYDLGTRDAYLRGFEDMRAKALAAVHTNGEPK